MSCSWCIKCSQPVSMYEKYCDVCVTKYGVRQDEMWHKYHYFQNWENDRKVEFEKDYQLALQSTVDFQYSQGDKMPIITIYEGEDACQRCYGWKRIDDGDEGGSWKYWAELPAQSALAVQLGIVKPIECPHCHGTGVEPAEERARNWGLTPATKYA